MGETVQIAEMATEVSTILKFFKWEKVFLKDLNFECNQPEKHSPAKSDKYTHPVDVVFYYKDPYTLKTVFFNTDLKSYADKSITAGFVRKSLKSLAHTIDCASVSDEWAEKYITDDSSVHEVRALLFIYNHDDGFDKNFYDFFKRGESFKSNKKSRSYVDLTNIGLQKGQYLHIFDPGLISHLLDVVNDVKLLRSESKFPRKDYVFYHPELILQKPKTDSYNRPATAEMLSGPYIMIWHPPIEEFDDNSVKKVVFEKGLIIYVKDGQSDVDDFMYLLDKLSNYQLLESECLIRIRMPYDSHSLIERRFKSAIDKYSSAWGYDRYKKEKLDEIQFGRIAHIQPAIFETELASR